MSHTPLIFYHWVSDRNGMMKKIKTVDGKPVAILIDDRFYELVGSELDYYNEVFNTTTN